MRRRLEKGKAFAVVDNTIRRPLTIHSRHEEEEEEEGRVDGGGGMIQLSLCLLAV